jgi:AcrR family transcriptional regulator
VTNSSGSPYPRGRRPSSGGASGTRDAIVAAAARRFAELGYDRASLRAIASDAGVDQKLIAHFFGSKQELFVAAVGLPLNPAEVVGALLAGGRRGLRGRITVFLATLLEQPELHQRLTGIVRAAASEPDVARMMREFLTREVFGPVALRLEGDRPQLRANLVGSQVVGLLMARYVVALEPLASTPGAEVAAAVAPTIERYLAGPLG